MFQAVLHVQDSPFSINLLHFLRLHVTLVCVVFERKKSAKIDCVFVFITGKYDLIIEVDYGKLPFYRL